MNQYLITIASPECPGWPIYPRLEQVVPDVATVEAFFLEQGYKLPLKEKIPIGATSQRIETELDDWLSDRDKCTPDDLLVVYVTGHGGIDRSDNHFLVTSDSQENKNKTRIETGQLAGLLFNRDVPGPQSILLLLDVCYAGQGGNDLLSSLGTYKSSAQDGAGFHIIVSAGPFTEAADGAFVDAFQAAMHNKAFLDRGGQEYLSPYDLTIAINEQLDPMQEAQYDAMAAGRQRAKFIRNPQFTREFDGKLLSDQAHWKMKARGGDDAYGADWFFSGRRQALRELTDWLQQPQSDGKARVVTSAPGSGKSALLGRLVLAVSTNEKNQLSKEPADTDEQVYLAANQNVVGINATGETLLSLTKTLSKRLGFSEETVDELIDSLSKQATPVGIVIDSLDEATEAALMVDKLLYPLAGHPAVRLIVGSRRFGERVPLGDRAKELNLDAAAYFSTVDIADYVFARLTRRQTPTVYASPEQQPNARRLADYIAGEANQSFLYARLVSRWFESADYPLDTLRKDWEKQITLPADVPTAFGQDLDRFNKADRQRIVELLTPLAYAKGKGLPQKTIWYTVASALADRAYRNYDINDIKNQVSYYLVQDSENGEIVFRLFHKALADYLRYLTRDESIEQRFVQALYTMSGSDWQGLLHEPYLRAYLPAHAAAGGQLDTWMTDIAFLIAASPMALIPLLPLLRTTESRRIAGAYRVTVSTGQDRPSGLSVSNLRWQAIRYGAVTLAEELQSYQARQPTFARWGVWNPALSSYAIAETPDEIKVLKTGVDQEGNPIAVCGYVGGRIRVWELNDGTIRMNYMPLMYRTDSSGEPEYPEYITLLQTDNELLIIVVWSEGTLRVLGLTSGHELSRLDINGSDESKVTAMLAVHQDEQPILIVATADCQLCSYSLPGLKRLAITATVGKVYSFSNMTYEGKPVLVASSDSLDVKHWHMVELWDLATLTMVWQSAETRSRGWVYPLVTVGLDETAWIVALHSFEGVFLFEPATNRQMVLENIYKISDLLDCYVQKNSLYIVGHLYTQLRILTLVASSSSESTEPFSVTVHPNVYTLPSQGWSRIVYVHDRATLVSIGEKELRIWDVGEMSLPIETANSQALPSNEGYFTVIIAHRGKAFTVNSNRHVRAWDENGRLIWIAPVDYEVIAMSLLFMDGNDLLVLCLGESIAFIAATTGKEERPRIQLDGVAQDMAIHTIDEQPVAFISVKLPYEGGTPHYFVRTWNLVTGEEQNTLIPGRNHKRYYEAIGEAQGDYPPQPWAFQMSGYYKTKPLNCVRILEWQDTVSVILAGPNGEVRAIDYYSYLEIDVWYIGRVGIYVKIVDTFTVDNYPFVLAGNEDGNLAVRNLALRETTAHRELSGNVTALFHHQTDFGLFLLVGTSKGSVSFWTPDLICLHQIETHFEVHSLALIADKQLVVGTVQGFMVVDVDWSQVAQPVQPLITAPV